MRSCGIGCHHPPPRRSAITCPVPFAHHHANTPGGPPPCAAAVQAHPVAEPAEKRRRNKRGAAALGAGQPASLPCPRGRPARRPPPGPRAAGPAWGGASPRCCACPSGGGRRAAQLAAALRGGARGWMSGSNEERQGRATLHMRIVYGELMAQEPLLMRATALPRPAARRPPAGAVGGWASANLRSAMAAAGLLKAAPSGSTPLLPLSAAPLKRASRMGSRPSCSASRTVGSYRPQAPPPSLASLPANYSVNCWHAGQAPQLVHGTPRFALPWRMLKPAKAAAEPTHRRWCGPTGRPHPNSAAAASQPAGCRDRHLPPAVASPLLCCPRCRRTRPPLPPPLPPQHIPPLPPSWPRAGLRSSCLPAAQQGRGRAHWPHQPLAEQVALPLPRGPLRPRPALQAPAPVPLPLLLQLPLHGRRQAVAWLLASPCSAHYCAPC